VEILKQDQYSPVTVEKQIAIIYLGTKGLLRNVPVKEVKDFEDTFLTTLEKSHPEVLKTFKSGKLTDEAKATVEQVAKDLSARYS